MNIFSLVVVLKTFIFNLQLTYPVRNKINSCGKTFDAKLNTYSLESIFHFRKVLPELQKFANIKLFQFRILRTKKYLAWNLLEFSSVRQLISRWSRLKNLFLQIDYFLYGRVIFTWKTSSFCSTNVDVKIDFK